MQRGLGYISVLLELYTMKAGLTKVGNNWRSNPRKSVVIVLEVHCGRSIIQFMINVPIMLPVIIIRQVSSVSTCSEINRSTCNFIMCSYDWYDCMH